MTTFTGRSTAIARGARLFKSSRTKCSSMAISVVPFVRDTPTAAQKLRIASAVKPRRRIPERGHARIVPARDVLLLHQLQQLALAQERVSQVEAIELDLL